MNVAIVLVFALFPNLGYSINNTFEYDACSDSNVCLAYPDGCYSSKTCIILMSSNPFNNSAVKFEVIAEMKNLEWVGVGLSEDEKMDYDSVTECVLRNGVASLEHSWNSGSHGNKILENGVEGMVAIGEQEFKNGKIYCRWIRNIKTTVEGVEFDLQNNKYYVLLAAGVLNHEKTLKEYHYEKKIVTPTARNLTSILNKPVTVNASTTTTTASTTTTQPSVTKATQKPKSSVSSVSPASVNVLNPVLLALFLISASISTTILTFM